MSHNEFGSLQQFQTGSGKPGHFYSLPRLERTGVGKISRLPVSIRIVLESVLRHQSAGRATPDNVTALANWAPSAERTDEIPFVVARVLLQDFTGVPLLVDLAAMRSAVERLGKDPRLVEPLVPVDLVIDHSVQVDFAGVPDALQKNMQIEFERNSARYEFLKWGMHAFKTFGVVPPGIGICHQVNLEYLARVAIEKDGLYFPDTLVGADSHTTMVNGLGVVGWGVGGIEAEAAMLGQPVYILTPDVVGVHLTGALKEGVTATDLVLAVTEMLRKARVVGKFVEYFGDGAVSLSVPDRATLANMSPEYGATMGYFPVDDKTCEYLLATGRSEQHVQTVRNYFEAQEMFGVPRDGQCDYSQTLNLDLDGIQPAVAGPKRPQDRVELSALKNTFKELLGKPLADSGYNKTGAALFERYPTTIEPNGHGRHSGGGDQSPESAPVPSRNATTAADTSAWTESEMLNNRPTPDVLASTGGESKFVQIGNGDVLIAAITSCTNTSNPSVMLAAGLLAKKAAERGLRVPPFVKTSLAPGSRVVSRYLERTGLQKYLDQVGFETVGYGCTTCIGNSGPLDPRIEEVVTGHDLVGASVLSGNRNFEARVHQNIRANFLMSPPLVVAFALAGTVNIDLSKDPLGKDTAGSDVYLRDIWPSLQEISGLMQSAFDAESYRALYSGFADQNPLWNEIPSVPGVVYKWNPDSTYIQEPPYFIGFNTRPGVPHDVKGARPLAIFGDSVTTDHISPAGAIKPSSPAGTFLKDKGVEVADFNSYGARRGNHEVMMRGTFANVRIKNLMVPGVEGGVTLHQPDGKQTSIYDAAMQYQKEGVPLMIVAGQEYGTGSSRDWAAKGTVLLGVKAVVADSFERIHRSNLVGMGVLPCQFKEATSARTLGLSGTETFDLIGLENGITPRQNVTLVVHRSSGASESVPVTLRIDTPVEVDYYIHGGILPYVLRHLIS